MERLNRTQELSRTKDVSAKTFAIVSELHSSSGWALQTGGPESSAGPAKGKPGALLAGADAEEEQEKLLAGMVEASPSGRGLGARLRGPPARPVHVGLGLQEQGGGAGRC